MKQDRIAAALLSFALVGGTLAGCSQPNAPVIEKVEPGSAEGTGSVTPLERGRARREALNASRAFVKAWTSSDTDKIEELLPEAFSKQFVETWDGFEKQGLSIKHVHDVSQHDVTQFNEDLSQALVSYTYKDDSYLVDASGAKVRELDPIDEDATITLEKEDDEWRIVRVFMASESFR